MGCGTAITRVTGDLLVAASIDVLAADPGLTVSKTPLVYTSGSTAPENFIGFTRR